MPPSRAVEATGVDVEWERVEAGAKALEDLGQLLPDDVFASLECTRVGLKGPTATPIGGGHQSINVALRKKLGLYVNFRPVRMLPGLKTRFSDLAHRPGHLPREYRGSVLRPGARSGSRRGGEPEDHHQDGVHEDRAGRLRIRAARRAPQGRRPSTRPTS